MAEQRLERVEPARVRFEETSRQRSTAMLTVAVQESIADVRPVFGERTAA